MKRSLVFTLAAFATALSALAACASDRNPVAPTSAPGVQASVVSASEEDAAGSAVLAERSSACVAADERLTDMKADLATTPDDADLQESVRMYEGYITTSCN
jgi:hypothetical protein